MSEKSVGTLPEKRVASTASTGSVPEILARTGRVDGRRRNRLDSARFIETWRVAQEGAVLSVSDFPSDGLPLGDGDYARVMCIDGLDAECFDDAIAEIARIMKQEGAAILCGRLGHNPIARIGRKRRLVSGSPRSFRLTEPLGRDNIDRLRAHFGGVEIELFDILTFGLSRLESALAELLPGLEKLCAPFWPVCLAVDRMLLRCRPLRRYGCTVVAVVRWPRRHEHA